MAVTRLKVSYQRPSWLPTYLPELDGLRGLAILAVVLYHCDYKQLESTRCTARSSGDGRGSPLFCPLRLPDYRQPAGRAREAALLSQLPCPPRVAHLAGLPAGAGRGLPEAPWFIGPNPLEAIKAAPWWAYLFFVQNLFHLTLPPALGPTWALAIEEQYYFFWAPRSAGCAGPGCWRWFCLRADLLAADAPSESALVGDLPSHTLIKLDGIALGSLLALAIYTLQLSRRIWLWIGLGAFALGIAAAATVAGGTSLLDTALAVGFAGAVLAVMASTGARNPRQRRAAPRAAGLLWPHQLRPLHDPHHGLHLHRLVRPEHERAMARLGVYAVVALRLAVYNRRCRGALVRL